MKHLTLTLFLFLCSCGGRIDESTSTGEPEVKPLLPQPGGEVILVEHGECIRLTGYYDMKPSDGTRPPYRITLGRGPDAFEIFPWYKGSYTLVRTHGKGCQ